MTTSHTTVELTSRMRRRGLYLILAIGLVICFWQLGSTGLVDETPPLFAAASRAMSNTGDWLTPRVNGLPRFDKPPLVYWLMGLGYSIPGNADWDPLGTWSARFPSAASSLFMMLLLGDTVMRWPHRGEAFPRRCGLITALAFAFSPLVMIWSRIAVSDALLCTTLGSALIFQWRSYAKSQNGSWRLAWVFLGLAVLTKGPVAVVLMTMTLVLFGSLPQIDFSLLLARIRPVPGFCITALVSLPWYLLELRAEGQAFWDSFFGYHNLQRFTSVVNFHQEPWWFFVLILIIASLPFTPFLILGLFKAFSISFPGSNGHKLDLNPRDSLVPFAACWLICVFVLFTSAATKLPSYWLPATPAAALLIGCVDSGTKSSRFAWWGSIFLSFSLALVFWSSPFWLLSIKDPELPTLGSELLASRLVLRAAISFTLVGVLGIFLGFFSKTKRLLAMQAPLLLFQMLVLVPMISLGDQVRQAPLRQVAKLLVSSKKPFEALAMVGTQKPSIHFYTGEVIIYEGRSAYALVNLEERLRLEKRKGWSGSQIDGSKGARTALVVIDKRTAKRLHWQELNPEIIGEFGVYMVWRLDRQTLKMRANRLVENGFKPNWRAFRPERF